MKKFFNVHSTIKWNHYLDTIENTKFIKQRDYCMHEYVNSIKLQNPEDYCEEENKCWTLADID